MATAALDAPLTNGATQTWHEKYNFDTGPIPIEPYISEDYFKLEQERVFRKVWLNVGRIEQIPNPGDYFVKDLPMCRTSLIRDPRQKGPDPRLPQYVRPSWQQGGVEQRRLLPELHLQVSRLELWTRRDTQIRAGRREFF